MESIILGALFKWLIAIAATAILAMLWRLIRHLDEHIKSLPLPRYESSSRLGTYVYSAESIEHEEAEISGDAWDPLGPELLRMTSSGIRLCLLMVYFFVIEKLL
ncbi:MAG: hypothetical protein IT364_14480 [Candidatus Hydrogenedentes bacterium]|nr:hypothetical protein [Candidatus Hydrogenedentota bacterium]